MRKPAPWLIATTTLAAGLAIVATATVVHASTNSERALPPRVVTSQTQPAAAAAQPAAAAAQPTEMARPEAIFDQRALILPPGSTLSYGDAAALLGVSSVGDSSWPQNGGPAGRATFNGSGWSGGAGAWALIANASRYGQLYVVWQ